MHTIQDNTILSNQASSLWKYKVLFVDETPGYTKALTVWINCKANVITERWNSRVDSKEKVTNQEKFR